MNLFLPIYTIESVKMLNRRLTVKAFYGLISSGCT